MITAENLCKRYGNRMVVDSLCLRVNRGEILGFIGPNGAGKTTTMRMLGGIMPVYSGNVEVADIPYTNGICPVEAKRKIGYLPENAPLPPSMKVRQFLQYAAVMRGIARAELAAKIELAIERCALHEVLHQEIESLSKGFKRRVCLAQAIIHEPDVLILDEPTDGLDPNQKRDVRALIRRLGTNSAVIISTHLLEEVEAVCNRVFLICAGKMKFDGTRDDFMNLARKKSLSLTELFSDLTDNSANAGDLS